LELAGLVSMSARRPQKSALRFIPYKPIKSTSPRDDAKNVHQRQGDTSRSFRANINWGVRFALLGWLLCGHQLARAGQIVVVLSSDAAPYAQAQAGFVKAIGNRAGDCHSVLLKDLTAKGVDAVVGKDVDCVVAVGTPAAAALVGKISSGAPMVFCMVAGGSAAAFPSAKAVYGVTTEVALGEQFNLIKRAVPNARVLGMLYRSNTPDGVRLFKDVGAALSPDWHLEAVAVDQSSSVADAINKLMARHVDVIWTSVDSGIYDAPAVHALLLAALRANLPVFGFSAPFVRAGALVGVGVDPAAQGIQAAEIATQVLGHSWDAHKAAVQPPATYQIAVNQIVADKIGIPLPKDLLDHATYVFKDDK
jgi:putative ABC transport system substrate-binding protein